MKKIIFQAENMTIEELDKQELLRLKMWIARTGDNAHDLPITEKALKDSAKTLVGKPVVAKVEKGFFGIDFEGHHKKEQPIGTVLSEDDIFFEKDEDGVEWLCAYATVWARYCKDASFIIERDKIKSLSMEILSDIDEDDNIVEMYFVGITLLGTFVNPAIEDARAELLEFSKIDSKIKELYFQKEDVTDFPNKGDNKKISLKNSNFPQFDYEYAVKVKKEFPKVWSKGGNIRGNEAFEYWGKARKGSKTKGVLDWIDEREAWASRHHKDKLINGVVASMKWGVIVSRGESYMKDIIQKEIDKKYKDFSIDEDLKESELIEIEQEVENFEEGGHDLKDKKIEEVSEEATEVKMAEEETEEKEVDMAEEEVEEKAEEEDDFSDEEMKSKAFSKAMHVLGIFESEDSKFEADGFSEKFEKAIAEYQKMKDEHSVYMGIKSEYEDLKKFKCDYEEKMFAKEVEITMEYVSDIMPKEEMDRMREASTNFSLENINIWANEVKAKALDFSKPVSKDGITRMGLVEENAKKESNSIWDEL